MLVYQSVIHVPLSQRVRVLRLATPWRPIRSPASGPGEPKAEGTDEGINICLKMGYPLVNLQKTMENHHF